MKCESVNRKLADYVDGRCGPITRARIRRHLSGCEGCAEGKKEDQDLNVLLETWSDEQPSPSIWLGIREAIDMSPSYVPETPPVPWWARLRVAMVRSVLPYTLGAVTTALLVVVGLGQAGSEEPRREAVAPVEGRIPASGDAMNARTLGDWESGAATTANLRPEEVPLRMEEPETLLLILRTPAEVRAYQELLRRIEAARGARVAEPEPRAQPAGMQDDTH